VSREDVAHFAVEVLRHRMILNYDGHAENVDVADVVRKVVEAVPDTAP
jgi:MoxR-like ATPase